MIVAIAVILYVIVVLLYSIKAVRAKRKVGKVIVRFHSSNRNSRTIITLYCIAIAIVAAAIFITGLQLTFLFFMFASVMLFVINPSYLGENGLKAGLEFIDRDSFEGYELSETKFATSVVKLRLQNGDTIKLQLHNNSKPQTDFRLLLDPVFNKEGGTRRE